MDVFKQVKVINFILIILLLIGFALRFYKLDMTDGWLYLVDVSKDILVGEHIVEYKEFTLAAPSAVGGQNFLRNSPLHYYFIALGWLLTKGPEGVLFCGVVLSVITIYLSFLVGEELESEYLGLLFALFFALNDLLIMFSSLTLQPFYLPFFTVLIIYLLLRFRRNTKILFLCLVIVSNWIGLNVHYSFIQLFFCFNLLILIMLFFDNKIKKVRGSAWLSYGLLTLILMTLWIITSRNYEFVAHLNKTVNLMNNQVGIQGFWQNILGNIKKFFGLVFFGYYDWFKNDWLVWIYMSMCLIFFVYLWIVDSSKRWILWCSLILLSGYLLITTISDIVDKNYFDAFVPILLFLVIYLFYKMAKVNLFFGLGLLPLFYLSLNSSFVALIKKNQITVPSLSYAQVIGDVIYDDYRSYFKRKDFDFGIYMATDYGLFNLGTAYYYSLEKEYGRILKVNGYDFKWKKSDINYVVCLIADSNNLIKNKCLNKLGERSEKKAEVIRSMMIDNKFYILYRVTF